MFHVEQWSGTMKLTRVELLKSVAENLRGCGVNNGSVLSGDTITSSFQCMDDHGYCGLVNFTVKFPTHHGDFKINITDNLELADEYQLIPYIDDIIRILMTPWIYEND